MKPQKITQTAYFIAWGAQTISNGQRLTMTVLPDSKGANPVTINVPNLSNKSRTLDPPGDVVSLSQTLKIGDKIQVTYDKMFATCTYKSASAVDKSSEDAPTEFSFDALKKVVYDGQPHYAISVGRAGMKWAFILPNTGVSSEEKDTAKKAAGTGADSASAAGPTPDPALYAKVGQFRRGDDVRVRYVTKDFIFCLKDIDAVSKSGKGAFVSAKETKRSDAAYRLVQISGITAAEEGVRLPAGLSLYLPADSKLVPAVEKLQPGQKVTFTFHAIGGMNLLDKIAAE